MLAKISSLLLLGLLPLINGDDQIIFASSAMLEIAWNVSTTENISFSNLYELEKVTAAVIQDLLLQDAEQDETESLLTGYHMLTTHVSVMDMQTEDGSNFELKAAIDVQYLSTQEIDDLAVVLIQLTSKDSSNSLYNEIFDTVADNRTSLSAAFKYYGKTSQILSLGDHSHGKGLANEGLLYACALLCVTLVFVSTVLLYVIGGWRELRLAIEENMEYIKDYKTSSRDEESDMGEPNSFDNGDSENKRDVETGKSKETNGAGGLGMNSTPERGITDDGYMTTPFSDTSNVTSTTETTRLPLGITSMRKMQRENIAHNSMFPKLTYE